jgi:hypothetical protein
MRKEVNGTHNENQRRIPFLRGICSHESSGANSVGRFAMRVRLNCIILAILWATNLAAQDSEKLADAEPSYIFATILGSGVYTIDDGRITVLRVPFAITVREETKDRHGFRLLLPVSLGYGSFDPDDPIERWLPTDVSTLSFVPGLEYRKYLGKRLLIKPYAQLGGGYDFRQDVLSGLFVVGSRAIWDVVRSDLWLIRVGTALHWAAELQQRKSSFGLFEVGLDCRRNLPLSIAGRQLNAGVYTRWRHFLNEWNIAKTNRVPVHIENLYEIGLIVGWEKPFNILGMDVDSVRGGLVFGDQVRAISFGTSFPF